MARKSHLIAALALSTALTAPAFAQDAEGQVASTSADLAGEDIVVTARRVEESLQTVPASVSAFNERALERIQAQDTTGLQGVVPNLNIVQGRGSSNATNIYIRGIGQPDALQTFDPAVGFYVDDVYYSRIRGTQLDIFDIERIEVLRGPQGTLYGKNTIGGALKVVTKKPGQEFDANASVAYGSYDQFEMKGNASGPITDTLAIGAGILISKRDGYVKDRVLDREYNDKDTVAVRGALAFTPGSRFRVDINADYSHDDASMNVGAPVNELRYLLTPAIVSLPLERPLSEYDFTARTSPGLPNTTKLAHWGVSGTMTYDVTDSLTLKSITAYRNLKTRDYIDIDATQLQVGDVQVNVDQEQISQELQASYNSGPLQLVGGVYYLKEDVGSHQEAYGDDVLGSFPPFCTNCTFFRTIDDDLDTKSFAVYGNGSFALTDALRVSAGLRYTREDKDYSRSTTVTSSFPGLGATFPYAPEGKWEDLSPMVSLDYQFGPDTMAYARYAKGFKSGGFNGRANSVAEATSYKPEKVDSFEVGLKTTIATQLRVNLAAFYNDYKDFQARVSTTDESQGINLPQLSVFNAGKLNIKGAEAEISWTPLPRLLLDAQVGYLDAEYKEFDDVRFANFGGSRAFQTPAFAPEWTLRFGAQYGFDLGSAGSLTFGGQTRYRSETALAVDNTLLNGDRIEGLFQKDYWLHDARIVWEDPSRTYTIGLYGQNLSDKAYKTDGQEFSSVGNIRTVYFGAPRTFTLRASVRY